MLLFLKRVWISALRQPQETRHRKSVFKLPYVQKNQTWPELYVKGVKPRPYPPHFLFNSRTVSVRHKDFGEYREHALLSVGPYTPFRLH